MATSGTGATTDHGRSRPPSVGRVTTRSGGALPTFLIVGGMKCGTTALHRYLDLHPDVCTSEPKELNFFFGDDPSGDWVDGNRWRGTDWYARHFDAAVPARGESSPGYTSPARPYVPDRIATLLPDVRLIYLTRDPLERAVSQYLHHRRDGTEQRPIGEALLDPDSQYVARSRHGERIEPYLERFGADRVAVVDHRELLHRRGRVLARLFRFLGVDPGFRSPAFDDRHNTAPRGHPRLDRSLRRRFRAAVADDVARLQDLTPSGPSRR